MYGGYTGYTGYTGLRSAGTAAAVCAALLLAGCSGGGDGGRDGDGGTDGGPAVVGQQPEAKDPYWVDPDGTAARQVATYEKDGDQEKADLIRKIAEQPVGEWIGPEDPEGEARRVTEAAAKADRHALLVLYNIPYRDCGQFSKGGAADGNAYRAWVDGVAQGIGDRRATVILEPDALLHLVDGCTPQEHHDERYALIESAVERLKQQPATQVYLDAGNAGWQSPEACTSRSGGPASRRPTASRSTSPISGRRPSVRSSAGSCRGRSGTSPSSSTPAATATAPTRAATRPRPGATRPAARWASPPPRRPATTWSTPTCGSSAPASPTATARAARRRARGGRSTRSAWPAPRSRGPSAVTQRAPLCRRSVTLRTPVVAVR